MGDADPHSGGHTRHLSMATLGGGGGGNPAVPVKRAPNGCDTLRCIGCVAPSASWTRRYVGYDRVRILHIVSAPGGGRVTKPASLLDELGASKCIIE